MALNHNSKTKIAPSYKHSRQTCLAGYLDLPNVSTVMLFDLRRLPRVNSRIVYAFGRVFELWSPNSEQLPFLPGELRLDFAPSILADLLARRYDRHAGKHDCICVPQYFRANYPHWPFLRHMFAPLTRFWVSNADRRTGLLDGDFILQLHVLAGFFRKEMNKWRSSSMWWMRPQYATEDRTLSLGEVESWEEAVDLGVALQRGLREQEAWIVYMETRASQGRMNLEQLRAYPLPETCERFVGVWINGLSEDAVLQYMVRRVPCFIVHEYLSYKTPRSVPESRIFHDFVAGTDVMALLVDENPYQALATEARILNSFARGDDGRSEHRLARAEDEACSSSVYLESLPPLIATPNTRDAASSQSSSIQSTPTTAAPGGMGATGSSSPPQGILRGGRPFRAPSPDTSWAQDN
ncbi:hypothetical protein B0H19DRAFT_1266197 [Mycena capillaripes]|nr:hypothetical protein B0H19DRAFT_1266197 [Mycena capillaripes]